MADDFEKLREEIAEMIAQWSMSCNELPGELADRILAIPAIADVLRMKPIQTMPVSGPYGPVDPQPAARKSG